MLKEYKKLYQQQADLLPGHRDLTQVELADGYNAGGPLKDSYLSAIVVRYWNIIDKMIYKDYGLYDPKEAYDWFMDALLYILNDQPWHREGTTVYKDPKGVEKSLNTCVKCSRANWFQASNRHKRRINHNLSSLEALSEEYKDAYVPRELIIDTSLDNSYAYLVCEAFKRQQYLLCLVIDVIVNDLKFDKELDNRSLIFNIKKCIKTLPANYPKLFAETYNLDPKTVEKSFSYIYNMSDTKLKQGIENYLYVLKKLLKGEVN